MNHPEETQGKSRSNLKLVTIPSSNQNLLGQDLLDELRAVINAPKYDHMTTATVIGVLEMAKLHYLNQEE